jgi:putative endonuclease
MKTSYVYILTNKNRTVFYTGVTADLVNRMSYHRVGKGSKFCAKYNVNVLVYYEIHLDIREAIKRETQIKRWNRQWKIDLIQTRNPELRDLLAKRFPLSWE